MNRNRFGFATLVVVFLLLGFRPVAYVPGDVATDFNLPGVDGKNYSLSSFKDAKGFIIVFTCNHCPYAKAYEQRIIDLDKKYKSKGYPVIAINPNDTAQYREDALDSMKIRAESRGFTFPYLWDESQSIAKIYGAEKTPHIYILQKMAASWMVKYVGAIDNNYKDPALVTEKYAENALDNLIAGKEVAIKSTKAIGCSIKWKH
ncbi:MAG: thioredoxin family protein [Bacteroidetes bacterium]|nr:thioredoxin family protein [Bacteroidota bacterium]